MLEWSFVVLISATVAAAYGYTGTVSTSTYIAKLIFFVFLMLFMFLIILSLFSTAPPVPEHSKLPL